ncbi:trans-acting enoyl reductase family protein [Mycobacterium sp. OTB74]|jgi:short subunit dehydrogenase-like uncharacterized protein|uniref:saccharopine dehydrogenase family protein n=1 Tax=Mycobacterium sp. OTB74 TaxID=1853452 RepID=UPI0024738BDD|nr:trans-acting enoyl reductase family protein [Mycobacterium sp. OTB74]MDH6246908.1 short subunit dehydrogenase-like uncharacterized protein [Mycobacterium sp. OTB74]
MTGPQREFDIVLYGATGFAGELTAKYLATTAGAARIALAGRSVEKLKGVRDSLGPAAKDWALIEANASAQATLDAMAERTQVVVTTVGPYTKYGLPMVAACAKAGTDYADLTGETMFVRDSIDQFHKEAVDTGARIVHACGFDSIPSDLTAYALYKRAQQDAAGELTDTDFVLRGFSAGVSGGTVASMFEFMSAASADPQVRRALTDPYTLSTDRAAEPELGHQSDAPWRRGRDIAPELDGIWTGAFVMGPPNVRIVRRSNALLDWAYGRRFRYSENMSLGSSPIAPIASAMGTAANATIMGLGTRFFDKVPRGLVERLAPAPGTGPSEKARDNGYYRVETYTRTTTGARYRAIMAQQGDPGYKATSLLLGECGLALAFDRDRLSDQRGVLTPAAAMGDVLLTRLPAAGVTLEVESLG